MTTTNKFGLTDLQQAYLMFLAILLGTWTPIISAWANNGMKTDSVTLAGLAVALIAGLSAALIVYMKEVLGINVPTTTTATTTH